MGWHGIPGTLFKASVRCKARLKGMEPSGEKRDQSNADRSFTERGSLRGRMWKPVAKKQKLLRNPKCQNKFISRLEPVAGWKTIGWRSCQNSYAVKARQSPTYSNKACKFRTYRSLRWLNLIPTSKSQSSILKVIHQWQPPHFLSANPLNKLCLSLSNVVNQKAPRLRFQRRTSSRIQRCQRFPFERVHRMDHLHQIRVVLCGHLPGASPPA